MATEYMVQRDLHPKELQGRLNASAEEGWGVVTVTGPYFDSNQLPKFIVVYKR